MGVCGTSSRSVTKMKKCVTKMVNERRCHLLCKSKMHSMKKLSFIDTCVFNIVTQIFFSIEQPTMDHENVHKKCCKYVHHLTYSHSQK
jgi:hypothetical protein